MKGVFDISGISRYDDAMAERYHFPHDYQIVANQLVGDWIVYRETRAAGGRMAYIGAAFVDRIEPDPRDSDHSYARVSRFLKFDQPVPYRDVEGRFAERFLREMSRPADAGRTLRGASVRALDQNDFIDIVDRGLQDTLDPRNRVRLGLDPLNIDITTKALLTGSPTERRIEEVLLNRKIRAANFRNHVLAAYDDTCAITGFRIVDRHGKVEAQAAHIRPVADNGPDIVQNGVALCATAHWLFDRHLIGFDQDFRLLISPGRLPAELRQLFPPAGERIRLPADSAHHPRAEFIAHHRSRFEEDVCVLPSA